MADLETMIVCGADGNTNKKGEIALKNFGKDFYVFFAKKSNGEQIDKKIAEVILTMPVGGNQNGLLRFPRIGEKILAGVQGSVRYLMAYVPNVDDMEFREASQDQVEADKLVSSEAVTLRYKSPHAFPKNDAGREKKQISEFKISTQKTYWPTTKDSDLDFPEIDRIDVTSSGDVITTAQNYNEVNASRIGLFAGVQSDLEKSKQEVLDSKENGGNYVNGLAALPLDNKDDNLSFTKGDVQVRADHRVVINAQSGIELRCGRSVLKIDDSGIKLISAQIDPLYSTGDDSTLSISAREGVSVSGDTIDLVAKVKYSLSEQMGGKLSSFAGMTRLSTHNFRSTINSSVDHLANITMATLQAVETGVAMGLGRERKVSDSKGDGSYFETFAKCAGTVSSLNGVLGLPVGPIIKKIAGGDEDYATGLSHAYDSADFCLSVIDLVFTAKYLVFLALDYTVHSQGSTYRDALNIVNFTINYALLEIMAIYTQMHDEKRNAINYASLGLESRGVTMDGNKLLLHVTEADTYEGPTAHLNATGAIVNKATSALSGMSKKAIAGLVVGGVVGAAAAGLGGCALYFSKQDADDEALKDLQEL